PGYASSANYRVDILGFNCASNQRLVNPGNNILTTRVKSHSNTARQAGANDIKQISNNLKVTIYPNPTKGIFIVQTTLYENTSVEIYSLLGQKLLTEHLIRNNTQLNLNNLANGIYQLTIIKNNEVIYQNKLTKID
ncbi:MAG: T9SS type A sorting domain-containing protein, partial [Bacteroidia bacterium]